MKEFYSAIKEIFNEGYTLTIDGVNCVNDKNIIDMSIGILNKKGKVYAIVQLQYTYYIDCLNPSYFKGMSRELGDLFFFKALPTITPFLGRINELKKNSFPYVQPFSGKIKKEI